MTLKLIPNKEEIKLELITHKEYINYVNITKCIKPKEHKIYNNGELNIKKGE